MTDGPTSKHPSDSNVPHDWEGLNESDVEQKLELAAELARELAGDVGIKTAGSSPPFPESADHSLESIEKNLDAELNELQHLAATTQAEVGDDQPQWNQESPEQAQPKNDPSDRGSVPQELPAVPDFMSEFTSPEPPAPKADKPTPDHGALADDDAFEAPLPPEAAPITGDQYSGADQPAPDTTSPGATEDTAPATNMVAPASSVRSPRPGVVGTGTLSASPDGSMNPSATGEHLSSAASSSGKSKSPSDSSGATGEQDVPDSLLLRICDRGVGALERIDRPFTRFGRRLRYLVGIVAVALTGASIVVFIYSLL